MAGYGPGRTRTLVQPKRVCGKHDTGSSGHPFTGDRKDRILFGGIRDNPDAGISLPRVPLITQFRDYRHDE
jgi:hypothetical protein